MLLRLRSKVLRRPAQDNQRKELVVLEQIHVLFAHGEGGMDLAR